MRYETELSTILTNDSVRMEAMRAVRSLELPEGWIGAGFVRDAVWDFLHGRANSHPVGDVDVIWFDDRQIKPQLDLELEHRLGKMCGSFDWSVKNQARMHLRNGDAPYDSVADAMRSWPETATAVAVRLTNDDALEINAPLGLDDLFALRLVPTEPFMTLKRSIFDQRTREKRWLARFPLLSIS